MAFPIAFALKISNRSHTLQNTIVEVCIKFYYFLSIFYSYLFLENLQVCPDPGEPENEIRRIYSFAEGRLASFGCKPGFKYHRTDLRTCTVNEQNNTFWDGK